MYFHSTYGRALGKDEIFQSRHDGLPAVIVYRSKTRCTAAEDLVVTRDKGAEPRWPTNPARRRETKKKKMAVVLRSSASSFVLVP